MRYIIHCRDIIRIGGIEHQTPPKGLDLFMYTMWATAILPTPQILLQLKSTDL
jgi:hypothetical protein